MLTLSSVLRGGEVNFRNIRKNQVRGRKWLNTCRGKHKGIPLDEIPHDYMRWCLANADAMSDELRIGMEEILNLAPGSTGQSRLKDLERENDRLKRRCAFMEDRIQKILKFSYGEMSRKFHPDAGGDDKSQIVVNLIFEHLKTRFRED